MWVLLCFFAGLAVWFVGGLIVSDCLPVFTYRF